MDELLEKYSLSHDDLLSTEINATDIVLTFSKSATLPLDDFAIGFHETYSVFLVAKESEERTLEEIVNHERVHNVIDCLLDVRGSTASPTKLLKEGKAKDINDTWLFDVLHEEILAELGTAEQKKFGNHKVSVGQTYFADAGLATAKGDASEFIDFANTQAKEASDPESRAAWHAVTKKCIRQWNTMVAHLQESTAIANNLGNEAAEYLHMTFVALQPSQYRHAVKLLEHKFGREKIEAYKKMQEMVIDTPSEQERLRELLEKVDIQLSDDLKEKIKNKLVWGALEFGKSNTLEDTKNLLSSAQSICESMGMPDIENDTILSFWESFMQDELMHIIGGAIFFDPDEFKIPIQDAESIVTRYIKGVLEEEILYDTYSKEGISDYRHKDIWKMVEHYDLQEYVEKLFTERDK
ncbi:hypothetical protein HQ524_01235 [Candidatus Uhrbacteria bacterium]|nr:hypothetical protein [Candidatus Uhrbacteria bacterium]